MTTWPNLLDPDNAYIFGLLQADGTHSKGIGNKSRVSMELKSTDVSILYKLQEIVPAYSSISFRTRDTNYLQNSTSAIWTMCDRTIREKLVSLGMPIGKKSAIIGPPNEPFSEPDYVRGIIDGDGAVGFTAKGYPFVTLVTASEPLVKYFCQYAERVTGAPRNPGRNKRDAVYNVMYTNDPAVPLAAALYTPGCLALPRKAKDAAAIQQWVRPENMRARVVPVFWTSEEDEIVLKFFPREAAQKLGRTEKSVSTRRWRLQNKLGPINNKRQ